MATNSTGTAVFRLRFEQKDGAVIILRLRLEQGEWLLKVWRELRGELVLKLEKLVRDSGK